MSLEERNLDEFRRQIDPALFRDDPLATALHSYDATNEFFFPAGVVRPRNAEDVQNVVTAANRCRLPLVPRGAGTGFSGGSLPVKGGVVLDFLGMNRLLDLDEESMTALVEPGLITLHLQEAATGAVKYRKAFTRFPISFVWKSHFSMVFRISSPKPLSRSLLTRSGKSPTSSKERISVNFRLGIIFFRRGREWSSSRSSNHSTLFSRTGYS